MTKLLSLLFLLFIFGFFPSRAPADSIRYIDEGGNIHWVDHVSRVPQRYRNQVLAPTPIPDARTQRWLEQRRREKEQQKRRREQEEKQQELREERERQRREAEAKRKASQ